MDRTLFASILDFAFEGFIWLRDDAMEMTYSSWKGKGGN